MPSLPPRHQVPGNVRMKPRPRDNRDRTKDVRKTARWQRLRQWVLSRNPLCADPFGLHSEHGHVVIASQVHHIVPLADDATLALDETNLAALCHACHARVTTMERDGRAREARRLFKVEGKA
jgi:5-methylcytosine-specific restriction endonuclease McrA